MPDESDKHVFGGDWTERNLKIIENYLSAYTTALKFQSFRKSYIDAFAGTGYRTSRGGSIAESTDPLLLPELAEREPQELLEGSVRRALRTSPPFDDFTFIEKDKIKYEALLRLKHDFPQQAAKINILRDDANSAITRLCSEVGRTGAPSSSWIPTGCKWTGAPQWRSLEHRRLIYGGCSPSGPLSEC